MNAVYDLSRYPANFNFTDFLAMASAHGADHVIFTFSKGDFVPKYPRKVAEERLESILKPACALWGMTYSFGNGEGIDPGYEWGKLIKTYHQLGRIGKPKSVLEPKKEKYTVTIRNYDRFEKRNSLKDAWLRFADEIGAFVIDEWYDKPLDLQERMAYYAGAEMNFSVGNGPASLFLFSDLPYRLFMKTDYEYLERQGLPFGSQFPWANENQKIVWCEDTYENIRKVWP